MTGMLARIHRIPEAWKLLFIGVFTVAMLFGGDAWPHLAYAFRVAPVVVVVVVLYADFVNIRAEPVNYQSIHIEGGTIEYTAFGETTVIHLADVSRLEFVREEADFPDLYGPYIESKWVVRCRDAARAIEVMDEWPHRKALLDTFETRLPGFDAAAARAGLAALREGRWLCYEAPDAGGGVSHRSESRPPGFHENP